MSVEVKTWITSVYAAASAHAYPKLLYTSLWRLWIIPQFDHGHSHWLIENDIHAIYLETIISKPPTAKEYSLDYLQEQRKPLPVQAEQVLTTYVFHHGYCWRHRLIYLEFSHHRSLCPAHSRCLETQLCLEVNTLRTFLPFDIWFSHKLLLALPSWQQLYLTGPNPKSFDLV